jgi:hypothetical protein
MDGAVRPRVKITADARQHCPHRNIDPEVLPTVVEAFDPHEPRPDGRLGRTITPRGLDASRHRPPGDRGSGSAVVLGRTDLELDLARGPAARARRIVPVVHELLQIVDAECHARGAS